MDPLSDAQLLALRNLADKRDGKVTAFLNIGAAQQLTVLGLAQRSRQGWDITDSGSAHLRTLDAGASRGEPAA